LERSDSHEDTVSAGAKERDGRVQEAFDSQGMHVARSVTARENAKCTSSRARTSSTRGSSTAMTTSMHRSLPRDRTPRRHSTLTAWRLPKGLYAARTALCHPQRTMASRWVSQIQGKKVRRPVPAAGEPESGE